MAQAGCKIKSLLCPVLFSYSPLCALACAVFAATFSYDES